MTIVVNTQVILQMMRNRVFEVKDEYYLYLNEIEDKLMEHKKISISEWESLFKESNLPQEEYKNFRKIWIEAYVRHHFFRDALKELPNTIDMDTARRLVTVDDLAFMHILKLKLAYAYGDQISDYDAIINRWINNEYVVEWLKYESYRKLNEYWDILFASNESVFNSVLKYRRGCLEGLDPAKFILENVKTVDDLENVLRFTLYCYNDMILPRAGLDAIQQEYMDYSKNKPTKGYLSEIFKLIDSGMKTFNIYSLEVMLKLCIIRKELAGEKELTNEDRDHVEYVLDSMREYTEAISGRTVVDIYFKEKDAIERNIFPETTGLRVKKRYLLYAMRHYDEFSKEMVSEFAKTTIEEFTEKEFIEFAQQTWSGYRLHTMELWYQALMFGNYIPKYVRQELGCFCNTDELLMTLEVNDLSDDGFFKDMVYYYMTTTCFWGDLNRRVSKYILKNGYLKTWYELLEDGDEVLKYSSFLSHMIPGRAFLFHALQVDNGEYNRYLVSNTRYSFYVYGSEETFRYLANFKVYLESRLYGDLITLKEVRGLLQDYPEYILSAFDVLVSSWNLKVSRESLDLILDLCLVYYLKYQKEGANLLEPGEVLRLKDECLTSMNKKTRISNTRAADIFFGKA
jgi:hypothetical protein